MTTIRLERSTKQELEFLKREFEATSYDELMKIMIGNVKKKISMFGSVPGLADEEDYREHDDRY